MAVRIIMSMLYNIDKNDDYICNVYNNNNNKLYKYIFWSRVHLYIYSTIIICLPVYIYILYSLYLCVYTVILSKM